LPRRYRAASREPRRLSQTTRAAVFQLREALMLQQLTNPQDRSATGVRILAGAGVLGLLGDALLRPAPWGVSLALWMTATAALAGALIHWKRIPTTRDGRWLVALAPAFAVLLVVRDSETLRVLNLLVALLLLALGLAALRSWPGQLRIASLSDFALTCAYTAVHAAGGIVPLTLREIAWRRFPGGRWLTASAAVMRGLLIAVPLLLLFGGLFMAADAVFEQGVYRAFKWNLGDLFGHFVLAAFVSWLAAGVLRAAVQNPQRGPLPSLGIVKLSLPNAAGTPPGQPAKMGLGFLELATVIGLLDALFLTFVVIQLRYLFGGAGVVNPETGLTYAEYARRGFFELVTVAALTLPLLLLADSLLRAANPVQMRAFRWLCGLMVALLAVVMISALQRMRLYQLVYGLTELRLYTTAFMGWLGVLLGCFALTVLRGRRRHFAFGAFTSGLTALALLNLIDPDATIVRTNAAHATLSVTSELNFLRGDGFDARYLTSLSADAVPSLIEAIPSASQENRPAIARALLFRWSGPDNQDWRAWSWSRARAHATVNAHIDELSALAGADVSTVQGPGLSRP
jgi:hypothetical protein